MSLSCRKDSWRKKQSIRSLCKP